MAVVVVMSRNRATLTLDVAAAEQLAQLGVTDATIADGPEGSVVVLSGWAFDGRRHEHEVMSLIAPGGIATVLHGVADIALRPHVPDQGGTT